MSASNWDICPRCLDERGGDPEECRTFREDYEIYGADKGTVLALYKGRCTTCGLNTSFQYQSAFYTPRTEATKADSAPSQEECP